MQTDLPVVIMAKPVGSRCNMRCAYCYYLEKGRYSSHEVQSVMSTELCEKMIRETAAACNGQTVSFVWHGGEPTLAGIPFFRKALQLERRYLKEGQQAWNNLQTNGVLIDDEWAAFLSRRGFDVGVSIDGDAFVHDTNRRLAGGQCSHEKTLQGIRTLQKYGLQPDLLCTVNAETVKDPLRVYRALRELGTGWIQFIPIIVRVDGKAPQTPGSDENGKTAPETIPGARPVGPVLLSKESVTPEEYGRFLIAVFDEWVTHDLGRSDVQLFAECAHILAGNQASLCWMAPICGRVLIAEEDGAIYSCDHFVDDEHRLGMLDSGEIGEFVNSDVQLEFGRAKQEKLTAECRACLYLKFCNGAGPKDRFGLSADGEPGQYLLCPGLKAFFAHAIPVMTRVMEWTREGQEPEKVMRRAEKLIRE